MEEVEQALQEHKNLIANMREVAKRLKDPKKRKELEKEIRRSELIIELGEIIFEV